MKAEIEALMDQYLRWLQDRTTMRDLPDWVEITTPYLDRHNDHLQLYARKSGGGYVLTDDGRIINDLEMQGCKIDTPKRESILKQVLNGFGIRMIEQTKALEVNASAESFPAKKHALLQAMLAVNDLFYLAQPTVQSLFLEDVTEWLEQKDIRFTQTVKFTGKSGYDHLFDFVVPKSRAQPERVLQTMTRPAKDSAERLVFEWLDTREVRPADSRLYAIVNDQHQRMPQAVREAMRSYDIVPIAWSEREEHVRELAA